MDPVLNPYAPGAGTRPPELAGRDEVLEAARIALARTRIGRPSKSILMVGLRGVGKTVLLDRMREDAEAQGNACAGGGSAREPLAAVHPGAPTAPSPASAFPQGSRATPGTARAARARGVRVRPQGEVPGHRGRSDLEPEPGLADNGDLETDLQDLLQAVGEAAKADGNCVALFVDELQYVKEDQLAA